MKKDPYESFSKEELILRDHLAIDRTVLANERTILSYARTALAVIAAGATLVHFISDPWAKFTGLFLIILGLLTLIFGIFRYKQVKSSIKKIKKT